MAAESFPKYLIDQIAEGNAVLFLGAGFSFGALHPEGNKIPVGQGLSDMIATKFLDESFKGQSLMHVADVAISEAGIFEVQQFVFDIFSKFKPAPFHILVPTFKWKSIYTTNYDLILEEAYKSKHSLQSLTPVVRNTKDFMIFTQENSLPYFKLHGSLSHINDEGLPLILTPDQYITHQKNRDRLFYKFFEQAWNHTVLFVGFSFADFDILSILHRLDNEIQGRSRYFFVGPSINDAERRLWDRKGISGIKMTFEEFIRDLDRVIPANKRRLSAFRIDAQDPIFSKFSIDPRTISFSDKFIHYIEKEIKYVHAAMSAEITNPKEFYKGYFENWDPIIRNFDAKRDIKDNILSEVVLQDHYSADSGGQFLFLVKGHAGSGKSVLLKRIAWDAAVDFEKFCIFYDRYAVIQYELLFELYNYTKRRIFVFIDNAMSNESEILILLERSKKDRVPITIFSAERASAWNSEDNYLKFWLTADFSLEYLSNGEIADLLSLLERHNSLGFLETKSKEERVQALKYRPGFELLVTLYEATQGKPLKEIINDEFNSIVPDEAKSLYLTVSLLHRLNAFARAGLIGRVHGISLDRFRTELSQPLEYIVFDRMDYRIQDFVYHTRHPYIAELVVENVLTSQEKRYEEYIRVLNFLDIDYLSDRVAFASFTNAKKLIKDFSDDALIRGIFSVALKYNQNNASLYQQMAIFEAERGSLSDAEKYIKIADGITKGDDALIQHTFAELEYRKAENARHSLQKKQYLDKSIRIAEKLTRGRNLSPHSFHTILKSVIMKIELSLEEDNDVATEILIREFEKKLRDAKQAFPYQDFIMEVEARFNEIFKNTPVASELLEKAHTLNPSSPFITSRLVAILQQQGDFIKTAKVLDVALKHMPGDKEINFLYAQYLAKTVPKDYSQLNHYLGKSYTEGDNRHFAQFQHAKTLYLSGDHGRAREIFRRLEALPIHPDIKSRVVEPISEAGKMVEFRGKIKVSEHNFGWIRKDGSDDDVYFYRGGQVKPADRFIIGDKVRFNIAFNYKGIIATNIQKV